MRNPGTDEDNVQMSDVLCDFCERQWTETLPMIEGHQGACICGNCLGVAFVDVVLNRNDGASDFTCTMCRESTDDRITEVDGRFPALRCYIQVRHYARANSPTG